MNLIEQLNQVMTEIGAYTTEPEVKPTKKTETHKGLDYKLTVVKKYNSNGINQSTAKVFALNGELVMTFNQKYKKWSNGWMKFENIEQIIEWLDSEDVSSYCDEDI